jgi:hypothetical protein
VSVPVAEAPSSKKPERPRLPAKRARRRVIDPTKWDIQHLTASSFASGGVEISHGDWVYEATDGSDDAEVDLGDLDGENSGRVLVGIWRRILDETVLEEQPVFAARRSVALEEDYAFDGDDIPDAESDVSDLFGRRAAMAGDPDEDDAQDAMSDTSGLFARRPVQEPAPTVLSEHSLASPEPSSASPLCPSARDLADKDTEAPGSQGRSRTRSASPLFPGRESLERSVVMSPSSPREQTSRLTSPLASSIQPIPRSPSIASSSSLLDTRSPSEPATSKRVQTRAKIDIPQPLRATVQAERSRDLDILRGLLGGDGDAPRVKQSRSSWSGFEESDEEDGSQGEGLLRLRGGAGSDEDGEDDDSEESSSDEESSSEESSSSDSDSVSSAVQEGQDSARPEVGNGDPRTSLKDMFTPTARQSEYIVTYSNIPC